MSDDEKQIDALSYKALEEALCFLKKKSVRNYEATNNNLFVKRSTSVLCCPRKRCRFREALATLRTASIL